MTILRLILVMGLLFILPSVISAEVFQYFDQDGTLIITNKPHGSSVKRPPADHARIGMKSEFREDVSYEYYKVRGNNFAELVNSSSLNGPLDSQDNKRYAAQTKWNFGWSYDYDYSYKIEEPYVRVSLNIFDVRFKSDITVILPALDENLKLEPGDLKMWDYFVQQALDHEHDHVAIIRDPLFQDRALKSMKTLKTITLAHNPDSDIESDIKKAITSETEKIGHELIMTIKTRNDEYDRVTEHGIKSQLRSVFFSDN